VNNMDEKILEKMLDTAEKFFGSENDPEQMPITKESFDKLQKLHPQTLIYKTENGQPVSWIVTLPTSNNLAEQFLAGEINEKQLLELSQPQAVYEALYLCVAFTLPEYRRRGYITEMFQEALRTIPHEPNVKLFAWAFSPEGGQLIAKLSQMLGQEIFLKK